MKLKARMIWLTGLLLGSLLLIVLSLSLGAEALDWGAVWSALRAGGGASDSPSIFVLLELRLPRTLAALLAGAGLALAGCAFQVLLRNPLATPYTLGVASASALGAWMSFLLADLGWFVGTYWGVSSKQVMAFLFAAADVILLYMLASRRTRTSPAVLLLAGVTLGMLANSGIMLSRFLAEANRLVTMDRWLMGGVDVTGMRPVWMLLAGLVPCACILLFQAGKFDQYGFGADLAAGRGVNIERLQWVTLLTASFLTAVIVSVVGPVGFVGLVVPHVTRVFTGPRHHLLLPVSLISGGAFLCACDIIARLILPGETPIGIVTTLIGGPFFLYLLLRGRFTDWDG